MLLGFENEGQDSWHVRFPLALVHYFGGTSMEKKFCPRIVENSEAKANAEALSGGRVEA